MYSGPDMTPERPNWSDPDRGLPGYKTPDMRLVDRLGADVVGARRRLLATTPSPAATRTMMRHGRLDVDSVIPSKPPALSASAVGQPSGPSEPKSLAPDRPAGLDDSVDTLSVSSGDGETSKLGLAASRYGALSAMAANRPWDSRVQIYEPCDSSGLPIGLGHSAVPSPSPVIEKFEKRAHRNVRACACVRVRACARVCMLVCAA